MTDVLDESEPASDARPSPYSPPVLEPISDFGSNPGDLRMRLYVPQPHARRQALVVVLHGCRQTPEGYDRASGWSRLACRHGFLLLYPEQRASNNRDLCFSWFERDDIRRGAGEVESIRQMIGKALADHDGDARRVFICGLSAGGAMACAMLATYPEVFAGGAIIAGLPFGTAHNLQEAYESMSSGRVRDAKVWGDMVRAASLNEGPWPSIAVWHGTADKVVAPINAGEIVKQWTNVHGLGAAIPTEDHIGGAFRRTWRGSSGRVFVTDYSVPQLGHGAPVDDKDPPAPFFLPAGISSAWHIAHDWELAHPSLSQRIVTATQPLPDVSRRARRRLFSLFGL